jgi:ankyrin repeat protein
MITTTFQKVNKMNIIDKIIKSGLLEKKLYQFMNNKDFDINAFSSKGITLLHKSIDDGNIKFMQSLLKNKDIDINAPDSEGSTPLELAIVFNEPKMVKILLNKGAKEFNRNGFRPIHAAAFSGNIDLFKLFFSKANLDINSIDGNKRTPLHWAVQENNYDIVKYIIDNGGDVNAIDIGSNTPLLIAAGEGNADVVKLLLKNGANKTYISDFEQTAIGLAKAWDHKDLIKLLEE